MTELKDTKPNKGVSCSVKECAYHSGENTCYASKIAVGPSSASCCADTVCATYKPKNIG